MVAAGAERVEVWLDSGVRTGQDVLKAVALGARGTMIGRAFSSMPGLASGIALQIRNGEIKKYLIQPVDLTSFLLLMRVAHRSAKEIMESLIAAADSFSGDAEQADDMTVVTVRVL